MSAVKGGGLGCYGLCADLTAKVRVANVGFAKKVSLRYSLNGTWQERVGTFEGSLGDGYEQWTVYVPYIFPRDTSITFVVKCEVNGQTHWDNNYSNNYVR